MVNTTIKHIRNGDIIKEIAVELQEIYLMGVSGPVLTDIELVDFASFKDLDGVNKFGMISNTMKNTLEINFIEETKNANSFEVE